MNPQYKGVLALIKSSVTGEVYTLPEKFSVDIAVSTAVKHGIESMVYHGGVNCGIPKTDPGMMQLFQRCYHLLVHSERQMEQVHRILQVFQENQIHSLPLKGVILKELYPKPEMRRMGDADILIREEQYPQIKKIMQKLGYSFGYETDHEIVWKNHSLTLELHKKLIPERNQEFYQYFRNGWHLAEELPGQPHIYNLSKENTMLFLFTHLAKHYTGSGIGIQHMTDLWIYRLHHPQLDDDYIAEELKKLQLDEFYSNVMYTLDVWFENAQENAVSELITEFVFLNGAYGTHANRIVSIAARKAKRSGKIGTGKIRNLLLAIFPGSKSLEIRYPVLRKHPGLLPFIWIHRWCDAIFVNREKIGKKLEDIQLSTEENVSNMQKAMRFVGLGFRFEEKSE